MTSPSDDKLVKAVKAQLDQANAELPEPVLADLHAARRVALQGLKQAPANADRPFIQRLFSLENAMAKFAMPAALAAMVTVYVSYAPSSDIPALPVEFFDTDVPTVNVALLEDIEFANWLAEQDEEALL